MSDESLRALYRRAMEAETPPDDWHPDDALWERMACGEATAVERQRVHEHVLRCPACADTHRALLDVRREAAAFDPAVTGPRRALSQRLAPWVGLAAAACLLLVLAVGWPDAPAVPGDQAVVPTPSAVPALADHPAFRLDKAPVMLAAAALTPRGAADERAAYLDALGQALEPYRADDFPEASRRLTRLAGAHPDRVEPALYAGVALLLSGRAVEAVARLEQARTVAPPELADEVEWRLALAYVHAATSDRARAPLARLCAGPGTYRDRACRAAAVLAAR